MSEKVSSNLYQDVSQAKTATLKLADGTAIFPVGPVEPSPCMLACPAGVNIKAYVSLIAQGKFKQALEVVRDKNPLPGICGRVCTHPCEDACNRNEVDAPVAICWLKRFVADWELNNPQPPPEPAKITREEKVAIIGSGPAGLTAAHDLIRSGFAVTIYEALPEPGGMLIAGIPAYRLPRDILNVEIDYIRNLGVEIKTNNAVKNTDDLLNEGYDAVFVAVGAHIGKKLGVPGEDKYVGILDAVSFLREVNFGTPEKPGEKIIVIGGGNSAIDSARTALRLGADEVHIVYRRTRREMPANEAEIEEAEQEGIKIHYLAAPVKINGKQGKVIGMQCIQMKLGEPDDSGRRRPVPVEGSEFDIDADVIISAVSQEPDLQILDDNSGVKKTRWNTIQADERSQSTARDAVFAGGDSVTGPNTVIDAIAAGHRAANSIRRFLSGKPLIKEKIPSSPFETEIRINLKKQEKRNRKSMPMMSISDRLDNFNEVEHGFSENSAVSEAQRCLRCGPCDECHTCVPDCTKQVVFMTSEDGKGEMLFRLPPDALPGVSSQETMNGTLKMEDGREVSVKLAPSIPTLDGKLCRGCGDCVKVCEYNALKLVQIGEDTFIAQLDPEICRGCETCVAVCPSGALIPAHFTHQWMDDHYRSIQADKTNIFVISCHWNGSHVDTDTNFQLKKKNVNLIFVHLLCTGQLESAFLLNLLEKGADGVLVTGCLSDDCHYDFGTHQAEKTVETTRQLSHMLGFSSNQMQYKRLPKADTDQFVKVVNNYIKSIAPKSKTVKIQG